MHRQDGRPTPEPAGAPATKASSSSYLSVSYRACVTTAHPHACLDPTRDLMHGEGSHSSAVDPDAQDVLPIGWPEPQ